MVANHETELPVESEELPPLGPGQLRISRETAGKRVRSLYISYTNNHNVVEVDFVDGTTHILNSIARGKKSIISTLKTRFTVCI